MADEYSDVSEKRTPSIFRVTEFVLNGWKKYGQHIGNIFSNFTT
jgi:hypothetical protein